MKTPIAKEQLEGARMLQEVRSKTGDPMPLAKALVAWCRMNNNQRELVAAAHQSLLPTPFDPGKCRMKVEDSNAVWHWEASLKLN